MPHLGHLGLVLIVVVVAMVLVDVVTAMVRVGVVTGMVLVGIGAGMVLVGVVASESQQNNKANTSVSEGESNEKSESE